VAFLSEAVGTRCGVQVVQHRHLGHGAEGTEERNQLRRSDKSTKAKILESSWGVAMVVGPLVRASLTNLFSYFSCAGSGVSRPQFAAASLRLRDLCPGGAGLARRLRPRGGLPDSLPRRPRRDPRLQRLHLDAKDTMASDQSMWV
jgi:hypothetical protein